MYIAVDKSAPVLSNLQQVSDMLRTGRLMFYIQCHNAESLLIHKDLKVYTVGEQGVLKENPAITLRKGREKGKTMAHGDGATS